MLENTQAVKIHFFKKIYNFAMISFCETHLFFMGYQIFIDFEYLYLVELFSE